MQKRILLTNDKLYEYCKNRINQNDLVSLTTTKKILIGRIQKIDVENISIQRWEGFQADTICLNDILHIYLREQDEKIYCVNV